jgi:hypothetical protein
VVPLEPRLPAVISTHNSPPICCVHFNSQECFICLSKIAFNSKQHKAVHETDQQQNTRIEYTLHTIRLLRGLPAQNITVTLSPFRGREEKDYYRYLQTCTHVCTQTPA